MVVLLLLLSVKIILITLKNLIKKGEYNFKIKRFTLSPSYSLQFQSQSVDNHLENKKIGQENVIFEPRLNALYRFLNNSFLSKC
jgi:hypothetical protein